MKIVWSSYEGGKWLGPAELSVQEINEFLDIMMQRKENFTRPCCFMFESGAVFDAILFHLNYFPWRNYSKEQARAIFNKLTIECHKEQTKLIYYEQIPN